MSLFCTCFNWFYLFWFDHFEPVDDIFRIIVFGLLFVYFYYIQHKSYTLLHQYCDIVPLDWVYFDVGFMKYIYYFIKSKHLSYTINIFNNILYYSWICIIFGFGAKYTYITASILFFILNGITHSMSGCCHRYYCVMYLFFALYFSVNNRGPLSVDFYINKYLWNPDANTNTEINTFDINNTGFASKLAAIFLIYTLFAGGISKLINNNISFLKWFDGTSLYYYLYKYRLHTKTRNKHLYIYLKNNKHLFPIMASTALIFELISILALFPHLFSDTYFERGLWMIQCIAFHWMIRMIMSPNYIPQMICYLVFITNIFNLSNIQKTYDCNELHIDSQCIYFIIFGNTVILCLFIIIKYRIEWYPFTPISMYSMERGYIPPFINSNIFMELIEEHQHLSLYPLCDGTYMWSKEWFKIELLIYDKDVITYNIQEWLKVVVNLT